MVIIAFSPFRVACLCAHSQKAVNMKCCKSVLGKEQVSSPMTVDDRS